MKSRFDKVAKDWDKSDLRTQLSINIGRTLLEHTTLTPSMHIMDFGAGTGLLSAHVADKVAKIAAVDISSGMLEELVKKEALKDVVVPYCQNILHDPLGEDFDGIISAMALHHVEDTDEILKVFYAHLKPGGFIAVADLDKEDGSFHPADADGVYHLGFDRLALQQKLEKAGFNAVAFYTAYTVEKNGKAYPIFLVTAEKKV